MNKGFTVYVSPLEMDSTAHRLVELPMEQEKLDALQLELNTGSPLYTEVSDFCGREYLEEHLPEDMDLTELNLLADFNGAVLAAHPTRLGVQFVTWDWSFDRTGLNQGNYFQENYAGAKQDFAIRAGLISKQQIFNQEQLIEIYRCCSDTLDAGFDLTAEQEKCIRGVQEQIAIAAPDALERIREQEQHPMESYNQEPIM